MTIEERAAILRDKFNYLVKQYKKIERKKNSGKEGLGAEGEAIKNELALFFKEHGNFIRTRKNSFGTFDYENYVEYLKKIEQPNSTLGGGYRRDVYTNEDKGKMGNTGNTLNLSHKTMTNNYTGNLSYKTSTNNNLSLNLSRSSSSSLQEAPLEDKSYGELYKPDFNKFTSMNKESYGQVEGLSKDKKSDPYSYSFKNVLNTPYNQDYKKEVPVSPSNIYQESIYNHQTERAFKIQEEFIRSNRIEYKRKKPVQKDHQNQTDLLTSRSQFFPNQGLKANHTDFISGYYRKDHQSPPTSSLSPSLNMHHSNGSSYYENIPCKQNYPQLSQSTSDFYEKYVNKKVTVYDFIKDNDKKEVQQSNQTSNQFNNVQVQQGNNNQFSRSNGHLDSKFESKYDTMSFSEDRKLYRSTTIPNKLSQNLSDQRILPQVNNIYNNPSPSHYSPPPSSSMNRQQQVFSRPIEDLYQGELLKKGPQMHFSPEYARRPSQYPPQGSGNRNNTPLWKNQFVNMDTFNLQGRTPVPKFNLVGQQPIRSNTYTTLNTKVLPKVKNVSVAQESKKKKKEIKLSPPILSSSTSDDYQRYFIEDLIKETGSSSKVPPETSDFLYEFCDNFFEHVMIMSCALAVNAKRKKVLAGDVKLMLKKEFDLELPDESTLKDLDV